MGDRHRDFSRWEKHSRYNRICFLSSFLLWRLWFVLLITIEGIDTKKVASNIQAVRNHLNHIESIEQTINAKEEMMRENKFYYIYYASPSEKNPYVDRPYMKKFENKEDQIIFNQYPERFEKIYSDEINHIYLWKIK